MSRAIFDLDAEALEKAAPPSVPFRYLLEFALDGETPGRVLNDEAVRALIPFLRGPGTIVELGGSGDWYKNFIPGQKYEVTNFSGPCDRIVDMTAMPYEDASVDAFLSMFALEHVYDYQVAIDESYRCLKPGGRMLLAVPWMYYYHGAPDDYFRFSVSALDRMLNKFKILKKHSFGNRDLLVCQLFHEKRALGHRSSALVMHMRRLMMLPVLIAGLLRDQQDPVYAITQLYLCEK